MTIHLDSGVIGGLCDETVAFDAAVMALESQRAGAEQLPPRIDVDVATGFLRVMPAALGEFMGAKIMTLARGVGNRYLILVYRQDSGELLATLDAAEITKYRTAATTALAGHLLVPDGVSSLGLIGTGFEAEGHLRAFARLWPLSHVSVYSRSQDKRESFAARMSTDLGIDIVAVDSADAVCAAHAVTVLATKASEPVVNGKSFARGATVLSIGSTRPDLRELDDDTFARAHSVLVDDVAQVLTESGDVAAALACGALSDGALVSLPEWAGPRLSDPERDLAVFKSVGTAVQDLALSAVLIAKAAEAGLGRDIGNLSELKTGAPVRKKELA
ncbi:ornithine cyclodeaminase family protein [Rhodococcus sp. IEGM 1381]|uniref:ornithine cyclodeaminase family protein n=1 Tax=Rhodococcus sp. IEGM 1381 TaxID=3047085 RepID=UPI0024B83A46|nr:ornithine cyclodeaminase family protein [Rhodococcus sp. IEGM 1381]MDI9897423.1 ornithine cyclodeaminase family protein [Rhodococcus sp. IEGM 1381]